MILKIPTTKRINVPNYFAEKLCTLLVDKEDWPKLHKNVSRGLLGRLKEKHHHIVDDSGSPKEKVATIIMESEEDEYRLFDCKIDGTEKIEFVVEKDGPKAIRIVKISGKVFGKADFRSGVMVNCDAQLFELAHNEGYSSPKQLFDNVRPTLSGRIYHFTKLRYGKPIGKKAPKAKE